MYFIYAANVNQTNFIVRYFLLGVLLYIGFDLFPATDIIGAVFSLATNVCMRTYHAKNILGMISKRLFLDVE